MKRLFEDEKLGKVYIRKLNELGIKDLADFLTTCCTPNGLSKLAEKSYIREEYLRDWYKKADLFRIKGISSRYAKLIQAAGIQSTVKLSEWETQQLWRHLKKINQEQNIVQQVPGLKVLEDIIRQAKELAASDLKAACTK